MSLDAPDELHLRAAGDYIELGMFDEAQAELEEIDPFCRLLPEVLPARIPLYRALKKWDLIAVVARTLTEWNPEEPGNFVDLGRCDLAHRINSRGPRDSDASSEPASN